jgi:acyl phosphate:glycerol-3-phosphate acyltransferase
LIAVNFAISIIVSYLLGAIPFGKIVARFYANVDITKQGSGNIGGTNVLRMLGLGPAAIVIICDLAKAFLSVAITRYLMNGELQFYWGFPPYGTSIQSIAEVSASMACMLGHNWSVYIKFKGGKGVAAFFGGWIVMCPIIVAVGAVILVPTVIVTRQMSRGSILAALGTMCALMIMTIFFDVTPVYLVYGVLAAGIIIFQHRSNIERIQKGTELKLGNDIFKGPKQGSGAK